MKAIFLSDAHIKGFDDPSYPKVLAFLDSLRKGEAESDVLRPAVERSPDLLVIAGDFFDFWFARGDTVFPGFLPVIDRLTGLKRQGVRICLCEGNHDFFLGDYFTEKLGMEVHPEWLTLEIDGLRLLISHGDTVDRANRSYLALRRFLRSRFSRFLLRMLPLGWLWRIGRLSSETSKRMSGTSEDHLAETMRRFACGKFGEGYDAVILGHCHRPMLIEASPEGRGGTFATLGDWGRNSSYLCYDNGRFTLNRFSIPEAGTVI